MIYAAYKVTLVIASLPHSFTITQSFSFVQFVDYFELNIALDFINSDYTHLLISEGSEDKRRDCFINCHCVCLSLTLM